MRTGRAMHLVYLFILLCPLQVLAQGKFPGFEIQQQCRENLKMLNEAAKQYLDDGGQGLPNWSGLEHVRQMLLSTKYLPKPPVPPTPDCDYFIIYKAKDQFDWYCELHGMREGDRSTTFRYHEFQFQSKVKSLYLSNAKYKNHSDRLTRRVAYDPTLMENVKFHYRKNPFTTLLLVIGGLVFAFFVYRNVFGP